MVLLDVDVAVDGEVHEQGVGEQAAEGYAEEPPHFPSLEPQPVEGYRDSEIDAR